MGGGGHGGDAGERIRTVRRHEKLGDDAYGVVGSGEGHKAYIVEKNRGRSRFIERGGWGDQRAQNRNGRN